MGFKGKDVLYLYAVICGYGVGIISCSEYIEDPTKHTIAFFIGVFLTFSGWFWHYAQKPGGLIDRITDKIVSKGS